MARDDDGDRIPPAGLADGDRMTINFAGEIAVGSGRSVRNRCHRSHHRSRKCRGIFDRELERPTLPVEVLINLASYRAIIFAKMTLVDGYLDVADL